ncbi:MAG: hypothetical protein PHD76_08640 [Methylacidiphilales bacterium]|nr:hypothetical protein [Candidatus Methylacidiphilales bacterium]
MERTGRVKSEGNGIQGKWIRHKRAQGTAKRRNTSPIKTQTLQVLNFYALLMKVLFAYFVTFCGQQNVFGLNLASAVKGFPCFFHCAAFPVAAKTDHAKAVSATRS